MNVDLKKMQNSSILLRQNNMIDQGFECIWTDQKSIIKHKPSQKAREGNGGGQGIIVLKTKEILFICNVMFQNTVTLGNNDKLSY